MKKKKKKKRQKEENSLEYQKPNSTQKLDDQVLRKER